MKMLNASIEKRKLMDKQLKTTKSESSTVDAHSVSTSESDTHPVLMGDKDAHPQMTSDPDTHPVLMGDKDAHPQMTSDPDAHPVMMSDEDAHPQMTSDPDAHPVMMSDEDAHPQMTSDPDAHPVMMSDGKGKKDHRRTFSQQHPRRMKLDNFVLRCDKKYNKFKSSSESEVGNSVEPVHFYVTEGATSCLRKSRSRKRNCKS